MSSDFSIFRQTHAGSQLCRGWKQRMPCDFITILIKADYLKGPTKEATTGLQDILDWGGFLYYFFVLFCTCP